MKHLPSYHDFLNENETDGLVVDEEGFAYLYRGDSSEIDFFLFDKTDTNALFGQGFYFTTSRRIAKTYKLKGGESRLWMGDAKSRLEAERLFIRQYLLFKVEPEVDQRYKDILDVERRWLTFRDETPEEEYRARLYKARDLYDEMEANLKIVPFSPIQWQVIDRTKVAGEVTTVRVQKSFVEQCYDAEAEINPTILTGIKTILEELGDTQSLKYINWELSFVNRHNMRQPDDLVTTSLRLIYVECISKNSPLRQVDGQRMFRELFINNGYTGIRYSGGITIGAGIQHEAFVFWDEVIINRSIID